MTAIGTEWGLYVHIPFCQARCTYCDFNTVTGMGESDHIRYIDALLEEWQGEILPTGPLVSIFFGGGTPSLVAPELLVRVLDAVKERTGPLNQVEVTVETNPGTVTAKKLAVLYNGGVNRLSIGAQARQNHHLTALNRIHDVGAIDDTVRMARDVGFNNISLDAIYGLPGQTFIEWQETVDGLLALSPDHLSLYALTLEQGTPLNNQVERGTAILPDPDLVAEMADWAEVRLVQAGLLAYEISNFARRGFQSRHNRLYWQLEPYLALGAGAHAYQAGRRWWNVRGVRRYMTMVDSGLDPMAGDEVLSRDEEMREFLWLGLRQRQGVSEGRFQERFLGVPERYFGDTIAHLEQLGLLMRSQEWLQLTERGRDMANVVARALVDAPVQ